MPRERRARSVAVETCVATFAAAAACTAVWLFDHGLDVRTPPQPAAEAGFARDPREAPAPARGDGPLPVPQAGAGAGRRATDPLRVRVPSLALTAPLTRLGLTESGALEAPPPQDAEVAGWYAGGVAPGAVGTALIAGHVDNAAGPAVFYRLGAVTEGAEVAVDRRDGFTAVFTVHAVEVYEGEDFPDQAVYGPSDRPELRLITCGGRFDEDAGEYTGNVVVFAHLTDVRHPAERERASSD